MPASTFGWKIMTPVFDGAHEEDISELLRSKRGLQIRTVRPTASMTDVRAKTVSTTP